MTLDDDVAAALERLRRSRRVSLKSLVNEALRRGLDDMGRRRKNATGNPTDSRSITWPRAYREH